MTLRARADDSSLETAQAPDAKLLADRALMKRVVAGDDAAKHQLLTLLWRRVQNLAAYLSAYSHDAEDLGQEALLQILKSAASYRGVGCVEAWADVIAVRTVMKGIKHRRFWGAFAIAASDRDEPAAPDANAEQRLVHRARAQQVARLLDRLPPNPRCALVLKLGCGFTVQEVATSMEKPVNTVRDYLRKGRVKLRRLAINDRQVRDLFGNELELANDTLGDS